MPRTPPSRERRVSPSRNVAPIRGRGRRSPPPPPPPRPDWAWFFDIDGTLVEIASTPWGIVVDDDMPKLMRRLNAYAGGAVALVTGRAIDAVDDLLPLPAMPIAGQHGLEVRTATGKRLIHAREADNLAHVRELLEAAVQRHPALILEHKGLSLALHYRDAPRLAGYSHRLMRLLLRTYLPDFDIQKGKRVVELKPAGKDKGIAIRELMMDAPFAGRVPVFVGDDVTDEIAFRTANEMGGHSIKIGSGSTDARWRLGDVVSLRRWLMTALEDAA